MGWGNGLRGGYIVADTNIVDPKELAQSLAPNLAAQVEKESVVFARAWVRALACAIISLHARARALDCVFTCI